VSKEPVPLHFLLSVMRGVMAQSERGPCSGRKAMRHRCRALLFSVLLLCGISAISAEAQDDCTLEPENGSRQVKLVESVDAQMTWSACTSLVRDLVFQWAEAQGVPATSIAALNRASALVSEWEKLTKLKVSPFDDVAKALEKRASGQIAYSFGEDIPVSNLDVPGWDGVSVNLSTSTKKVQLTVHYWANP
jgi:hypothetical protein